MTLEIKDMYELDDILSEMQDYEESNKKEHPNRKKRWVSLESLKKANVEDIGELIMSDD